MGRLDSSNSIEMCGKPNTATVITANIERRATTGDDRRRAATTTTGSTAHIPRIIGPTINQVISLVGQRQLRSIGFSKQYRTGSLYTTYDRGILRRHEPGSSG